MTQKNESKGLSRRNFLKSVAAGSAAAAGSSVLGGNARPVAAQEGSEPSFMTPPPPISESEIDEVFDFDVVVIGFGTAGTIAALTAQEEGAKVAILQKGPVAMTHGDGVFCCNNRLIKENGWEMDIDEGLREFQFASANRGDGALARHFFENSGEVGNWLLDITAEEGIEPPLVTPPTPRDPNNIRIFNGDLLWPGGWTKTLGILANRAKAQDGIEVFGDTPAVQLIREEGGRVTGVIAQDEDGYYLQFNASKGVILCTGDFGNEPEMLETYLPQLVGAPNIYHPRNNTGDGHKMAMWVGAAIDQFPHCHVTHYDPTSLPSGEVKYVGFSVMPWLSVNKHGKRFTNEDSPYMFLINKDLYQDDKYRWQVFDDNWLEQVSSGDMGFGFGRGLTFNEDRTFNTDLEDQYRILEEEGLLFSADTLEGLAEIMEVPADALIATVERYNELAANGLDDDYGKGAARLFPIEQGPFHCVRRHGNVLVTLGGLKINRNMQVMDTEDEVIPGLYAAGNTSGNFFADTYSFNFPGMTLGRAVTWGRLAAKHATAQ